MAGRTPIWKSIADTLRAEIAQGHYRAGDKLPTEAEMSRRFGVNRHTVRHALTALSEDGIVMSRRGAGVFVTMDQTDYAIGRRVRFHQNILAAGRQPGKQPLHSETRPANKREAEALRLEQGAQVHFIESLSLADDQPVALGRSTFPASRFPDFMARRDAYPSLTETLRSYGIDDFVRTETRVTALPATATQALHLRLQEGAPLLRTTGLNTDAQGTPIEFGETWFAGDRVTLTLRPEDL